MEITKEQLAEIIKTDEGKALIGEVAQGLGLRDTTGLEKKRDELLGEVRSLKDKYSSIEGKYKAFEGLDPEEVKTALDRFKNPEKYKDEDPRLKAYDLKLKEIEGKLTKSEEEKKATTAALEREKKDSLILNAIKNPKAEYAPEFTDALQLIFDRVATLRKNDKGEYEAVVDTGESVLSIDEFAIAYAKTDKGKPYKQKPINTSANARQFSPGTRKTVTEEEFKNMNPKDAALFFKNGGSIE
ncbi:MAG TPA: hypothetical protein PKL77_07185 [Candidatus Omnitrophota bacterium]|nr:hypothetical protein [Candidatus Omnitrophota bacterium]